MNRKPLFTLTLLFLLVATCGVAAFPVKAQNYAIVVPDQYPTITDALVYAHAGDTIFVRSGTYNEHLLTINCSLTLVGQGPDTTVINCLDSGYLGYLPHLYGSAAIRINANNIAVSGFTFQGGMLGIYGQGDGAQIIGNVMAGAMQMVGSRQIIANNTVGDYPTGPATALECTGDKNIIAANHVISSMTGIDVKGWNNFVYDNAVAGNNGVGIQLDFNTTGTLIAKNYLSNCSVTWGYYNTGNTVCGNYIDGAFGFMGFNNVFYGNTLTYFVSIGGTHGGSVDAADNLFYQNNFLVNPPEVMLFTSKPGRESWDNGNVGNYWGGNVTQSMVDANNDGIADQPYTVATTMGGVIGADYRPLMTPFDISTIPIQAPPWTNPIFNPSAYTLEPAGTTFPVLQSTNSNEPTPVPTPSLTDNTQKPEAPQTIDNKPDYLQAALILIGLLVATVLAFGFYVLHKTRVYKQAT